MTIIITYRFPLIRSRKFRWAIWSIIVLLVAGLISVFIPLSRDGFSPITIRSMCVVDRNGYILREFLNNQQGRGEWIPYEKISPWLIKATIAIEDKRFRYHPGVDPFALVRAVLQNAQAGAFRSGASTITQQVIRNVYHHPRTIPAKILEAWYALRLERMMTKNEILGQYMNRAPYGNQLFGVEAASRTYFNKPAGDLSLAEAAFLAALPNAPSSLNPYNKFDATIKRQRVVLQRMLDQKEITQDEYERAVEQPVKILPVDVAFRAPHAVEMISKYYSQFPDAVKIQSTIDVPLQQEIQFLVRSDLDRLKKKNVSNAAVVVIENASSAIRVLLGSVNFFDSKARGQINGALALRQPGSALKPFTYATAFQMGYTPATLLADIPTNIPDERGDYVPENYDKKFHGPVRARTALACSYNVPAVRVLRSIGKETLMQTLQSVGFTSLTQNAEYYGLGLTLGNAEVSLLELTNAYRVLANRGEWRPVQLVHSIKTAEDVPIELPAMDIERGVPRRVFDERAVYLLTDILEDPNARRPAFGNALHLPFPCAVKTGTTKDYKDNWTIGYTTEYTVGVWVGNFDGTPMRGVSGVSGAGQVFIDVMTFLYSRLPELSPPDFTIPKGIVRQRICSRSGMLPTENCQRTMLEWFYASGIPREHCTIHRRFTVTNEQGEKVSKIFEVYPPEFSEWAEAERLPQPPSHALPFFPTDEKAGSSASHLTRLSIVAPGNGEIFKIDPVLRPEYQSIKIVGIVPEGTSDVQIRFDDIREFPYTDGGVWWNLQRGIHKFYLRGRAQNKDVVSRSVTITIE
ncbi:MAG: penicillin-binding protein 1C [Bacteroidota bacterium]